MSDQVATQRLPTFSPEFTWAAFPQLSTILPVPRISFTSHLQKHVDAPSRTVSAGTVREALEEVFAGNPRLRSYILDDQGRVRQHVMIFIDDAVLGDRVQLSDRLREESEVFVMQALSGG